MFSVVKATILGVVETNTPFLSESDDTERKCPVPTFEADFDATVGYGEFYYR